MQFSRLKQMISNEDFKKIQDLNVLVVGLGGVGGNAVEALVRSGVHNLIIVDKDKVEISNLNRQLVSLNSTIGKYKVDVMKERILDINQNANVTTYPLFYNLDTKDEILNHKIDFICDCIDTITFKKDLIKESQKRDIPIITVLGMGNKFDPSKIEITSLHKTHTDPIARVLRTTLRKEGFDIKTPVVFSKEEPTKTNAENVSSNSYVPSIAGIYAASYILNKTIGKTT